MTTIDIRRAIPFACVFALGLPAMAQDTQTDIAPVTTIQSEPTPSQPAPSVALELNRLEAIDAGCRATFIVQNPLAEALTEMQLDTFFFGPDEVVRQRLALTFDNIRPERRKVVPFDLSLGCEEIATVLVNEVLMCDAASGPVPNCAQDLQVSTRAEAELSY